MNNKTMIAFMLLLSSGLWQCKLDANSEEDTSKYSTAERAYMYQDWTVVEAMRDGMVTDNLDGIYFSLTKDSIISNFNLETKEQRSTYKLEGENMIVNTDPAQIYQIDTILEKQILLTTIVKGFEFKLSLQPIKKDSI